MRLRRQQKRIERSTEKHLKKTGTKRIGTIRAVCAKMTFPSSALQIYYIKITIQQISQLITSYYLSFMTNSMVYWA